MMRRAFYASSWKAATCNGKALNVFRLQRCDNHMRACVLHGTGGVDNLKYEAKWPLAPEPGESEVRVRVQSCGVAYRDILDRKGAFPFIKLPMILGHEFAATVVDVGENVKRLKVGDRVASMHWAQEYDSGWPSPFDGPGMSTFLGITHPGGYAQYCTVHERAFVKVPQGWNSVKACSVVSTFGTVFYGAFVRGNVKPGETILITGASGGVGAAGVELFSKLGYVVYAVTSSHSKIDFLRKLGAAHVIVAPQEQGGITDFSKNSEIKRIGGVDVVIEAVGAPTLPLSLRCLRPEGRAIVIGNITNTKAELPLGLIVVKSLSILGTDSCSLEEMQKCFNLIDRIDISPHIHKVFKLEEVQEAHKALESREIKGRCVLSINDCW